MIQSDKKLRQQLRTDVEQIYRAGLAAVAPERAIMDFVSRKGTTLHIGQDFLDLSGRKVILLAFGKAAVPMAAMLEEILGEYLQEGIVVTKYGHVGQYHSDRIRLFEAAHPIPDASGLRAGEAVLSLARRAGDQHLVLVAISGGGSALLPLPAEGITLQEKQTTTSLLLRSGATIQEMNTVRKHLSRVKGGQLAAAMAPAMSYSLILSDVIGDPLEFIASGPTVPDSTTFRDALRICRNYHLMEQLPAAVVQHLQQGAAGKVPETPKPGDAVFRNARHLIVGNIARALAASRQKAEALNYHALILTTVLEGEAREIAPIYPALAHDILRHHWPLPPPACVLCGGEPTVTVTGDGKGGRNQELALAVLPRLAGKKVSLFVALGTDGTDGPTDAAGALVDDESLEKARAMNLDWKNYLHNNNAYPFFEQLGDLIKTGPTQTNVMDMHILLVRKC